MKPVYLFRSVVLTTLLVSFFCLSQAQKPQYLIKTYRLDQFLGDIEIELFPAIAPLHVKNFDSLVSFSFYDTTAFHRCIPDFVIQGGDPNSRHGNPSTWGQGQPGQPTVPAEFSSVPHSRGILSAARATDINSATSQFFICHADAFNLDENYSVYGRVTGSLDIVDSIALSPTGIADRPLEKIEMFITRTGTDSSQVNNVALQYPFNGEEGLVGGVELGWDSTSGVLVYQIQIAQDSAFTQLETETEVPSPEMTFTGPDFITEYYWRIRATNGGYWSDWTEGWKFTTATGPPVLKVPLNNATNIALDTTLEWLEPYRGADSYHLMVSTTDSFGTGEIVIDESGLTSLSFTPATSLDPATTYFWKVRSASSTAAGAWSGVRKFTTESLQSSKTELNSNFSLHSYCLDGALISELTCSVNVHASFEILNLQGQSIHATQNKPWLPGSHTVRTELNSLPTGVYILLFKSEGRLLLSQKVLIP